MLREQIAALLERQGADAPTTALYTGALDRAIEAVKAGEPLPPDVPPGLRPIFNPAVLDLLHASFTTDPAALAGACAGPVLVVQEEKDAQVSAERDLPALEAALRARPEGRVDAVVVPGASHNFKEAGDGPISGFAGPVVPEAMEAVVGWLKARAGEL